MGFIEIMSIFSDEQSQIKDVSGIAISFDDTDRAGSWKTYDDAYGQAYGWKATFNLYNNVLVNYAAAINSLYDNGHELGNHSNFVAAIDPDTYLDTHTEEDYLNDYVLPVDPAIAAIVSGFPGTKTFTWPEGKDIISISEYMIANSNIQMTRDTPSGGYQKFYYDGTQQVMNAFWIDNGSGNDIDTIKGWIDTAKQNNTIVLMLGHTITDAAGDFNVPASLINQINQYVIDKNMKWYKQDELLPSIWV